MVRGLGELVMATRKQVFGQLEAVRQMRYKKPEVQQEVLGDVWAGDPAIQETMAPLIDDVSELGPVTAADIAFAIFLAIVSEEAKNGKDIEAG